MGYYDEPIRDDEVEFEHDTHCDGCGRNCSTCAPTPLDGGGTAVLCGACAERELASMALARRHAQKVFDFGVAMMRVSR